jgi:serine/threonine protein kinase
VTQTEDLATTLSAIVRDRAQQWFPHAAGVAPVLIRSQRRIAASLYVFRINQEHSVLIKLQGVVLRDPSAPRRPRVVPRPALMYREQAEAMRAATDHFHRTADPRFRPVLLLDVIDELKAIVMEYLPWPTLRTLYLRAGTTRSLSPFTRTAFATAGSWLRSYHGSQPVPGAASRDHLSSDFIASLDRLSAHIQGIVGLSRTLDEVCHRARQMAVYELPSELPLATSHGDFSPANILVAADGVVAVVDLAGRWLSPPYEDLAYFLVSLDTSRAALLTNGLALSGRAAESARASFVTAYYGDTYPPGLHLYRLNALLDVWGSRLATMPPWQWPLVNARFHSLLRHIDDALREVRGARARGTMAGIIIWIAGTISDAVGVVPPV